MVSTRTAAAEIGSVFWLNLIIVVPVKAWMLLFRFVVPALLAASPVAAAEYDLVIYGGTSAGVIAAVQAKKMGKYASQTPPRTMLFGKRKQGAFVSGFRDVLNVVLTRSNVRRVAGAQTSQVVLSAAAAQGGNSRVNGGRGGI